MSDAPTKFYFRQRQQNRLYDTVIAALEEAAASRGIRKKDIAAKLSVNPSQVTRWLSGPANWETDTVSDLLFAIDAEIDFNIMSFDERRRTKSNRFHPAGESRAISVPPISVTTTTTTQAVSVFVSPDLVRTSPGTPHSGWAVREPARG